MSGDAGDRANQTVEALEYLFLAIVTRADSDYLFRAINRAEEALRAAMPGWTPPVPMTTWAAEPHQLCGNLANCRTKPALCDGCKRAAA